MMGQPAIRTHNLAYQANALPTELLGWLHPQQWEISNILSNSLGKKAVTVTVTETRNSVKQTFSNTDQEMFDDCGITDKDIMSIKL